MREPRYSNHSLQPPPFDLVAALAAGTSAAVDAMVALAVVATILLFCIMSAPHAVQPTQANHIVRAQ